MRSERPTFGEFVKSVPTQLLAIGLALLTYWLLKDVFAPRVHPVTRMAESTPFVFGYVATSYGLHVFGFFRRHPGWLNIASGIFGVLLAFVVLWLCAGIAGT